MEKTFNNAEIRNLIDNILNFQNKNEVLFTLDLKLAKIVKALKPHYDEYIDNINKLKDKYAKKDDDGNFIAQDARLQFEGDNFKEFRKRATELDTLKVDVNIPVTLTVDDFYNANGEPIVAKELTYSIEPLIDL